MLDAVQVEEVAHIKVWSVMLALSNQSPHKGGVEAVLGASSSRAFLGCLDDPALYEWCGG